MDRIHPYEELIIKQRLYPTLRPGVIVSPGQGVAGRTRFDGAALIKRAAAPFARLRGSRRTAEPCPVC